ncbi:MAG: hypothetical protein A3E25_14330 [Burkholderiales bacterium RIFCSPHIGHO2_12_FULL_69_20]|nr:MAG: hypothetical protein A3E25_14330 [Burkholderiales bacterium RIFCSPHIGHO2_12_FULL_69_20]
MAVVLALWGGAASAQYKWKDSRGQLHASDQPPPREIPDKDVLQRPVVRSLAAQVQPSAAGASAPAPAAINRPPVDAELRQRRARAEQEAKARAKADDDRLALQRAENCQRARQQLATLDSGTRLVRVNEKGERIALDDAARASEMAQARNVIASECR